MYPYSWQWTYTVIALTLLLAVFFLSCAVLLLRRSPRRWHRMRQEGMRRAREREYYNPRGER